MNIKSNFYFVLIGYFREIRDIKGDKSAGEHQRSVERRFDCEKWETEPVSGVFCHRWIQIHLVRYQSLFLGLSYI
jgi:hypothetical protein